MDQLTLKHEITLSNKPDNFAEVWSRLTRGPLGTVILRSLGALIYLPVPGILILAVQLNSQPLAIAGILWWPMAILLTVFLFTVEPLSARHIRTVRLPALFDEIIRLDAEIEQHLPEHKGWLSQIGGQEAMEQEVRDMKEIYE